MTADNPSKSGTFSAWMAKASSLLKDGLSTAGTMPIQLRDADGVLLAEITLKTLLTEEIAVDPGSYIATVLFPTGTRFSQDVEIASNGRIDATPILDRITKSLVDGYPRIREAANGVQKLTTAQLFAQMPQLAEVAQGATKNANRLPLSLPVGMGLTDEPSETSMPNSAWPSLRVWHGTALGRPANPITPNHHNTLVDGSIRFEAVLADRPTTIQVSTDQGLANIVLLPGAVATVKKDGDIAVESGHKLVDELLGLRSAGRVQGVGALTEELRKENIQSLVTNPTAAVAMAYRLLRVRDERIDDVLADLEPLAHFADTLVLRAESAARQGKHSKALPLFLDACRLDLPAFASGLGFLTDRMRRYATLGEPGNQIELENAGLSVGSANQAKEALRTLQPYAAHCTFALPSTSYAGAFQLP